MNMLTGGGVESEPDLEYFETISTDAFNRADRDGSGQISFEVTNNSIHSTPYPPFVLFIVFHTCSFPNPNHYLCRNSSHGSAAAENSCPAWSHCRK